MSDSGKARLDGIHHLKFPVSDLAVSLRWWERALGAERQPKWDHFTPDGRLFAYILHVPGIDIPIELRLAPEAAAAVSGFDPVTLAVATETDLKNWAARLDAAEVPHSPVLRGLLGWLLALHDPDGLAIRLHTRETHGWDADNADLDSPWLQRGSATRPETRP
jgi:catechol 2,3-dioxygenase-like lactoylglutathione lyase family enzyme